MSAEHKVVAIIQARMAASRLPGKVLKELGHQPVLGWMVARTRRAELIDEVVIATTTDPGDDPVAAYCQAKGVAYVRGSMNDVLDRYYQAAKAAPGGCDRTADRRLPLHRPGHAG